MVKSTVLRWLTENRADTREAGPPEGRCYAAPFARVWEALLTYARARPRWNVTHADETQGVFVATCRSRIFRFVDDLTVWIFLDEEGLTRVEARSRARRGHGDLGVNRRRLERLFHHLDERFDRILVRS